jgi:hypothetical protein
MTKSSAARIDRRLGREKGRPPKDPRTDPDMIAIEFALALQAAWQISERKAFDLAVAWFEARMAEPTKTPRGASKHPDGLLVGYETFPAKTVSGRALTLRKKSRRHSPRPDVVAALTMALRCRDMDAALRLFDSLFMLAALAGPERLRRVVMELAP